MTQNIIVTAIALLLAFIVSRLRRPREMKTFAEYAASNGEGSAALFLYEQNKFALRVTSGNSKASVEAGETGDYKFDKNVLTLQSRSGTLRRFEIRSEELHIIEERGVLYDYLSLKKFLFKKSGLSAWVA